ncbi:Rft-1-domain-containing protein [Xylaria sp. CBS 124048]|nr:Rft-1-domain-containing protein [Xylaria sp. CBS 124048]
MANSAMGGNTSPSPAGNKQREATTEASATTRSGSAVRGASLLIILQVASRAVTFIANQLLLRFLTAKLLGLSAQLEVYYLSVLFFARESLRVAIQRHDSRQHHDARKPGGPRISDATDSQSVVNLAHLSIALGLVSSLGLGWAYLRYADVGVASTPYLATALRLYGIAALVELLSEPAFVVLQHRLRFGPRATAESIATFLRCLVTFAVANWGWKKSLELGVLPFALGQLAYGVGLLCVYAWYGSSLAISEGFSLLPRRVGREDTTTAKQRRTTPASEGYMLGFFFTPTLQLAFSLMTQSLVKHILTQGDTFLVSILSDANSQGVYALANNYGSLLARLVFQPIEESSRNYFSKLLSSSSSSSSSEASGGKNERQTTARTEIHQARTGFQAVLKFYVLLSIGVVTIGPYAAPLLVQIVAGPQWSRTGAGGVLARYCLFIPLLAINGITEAFVSSVATKSQVHRQSMWMGAFSLVFAIAGFVSLRVLELGAVGLVYANAINMLCRITWSGAFISHFFRRNKVDFAWSEIMPAGATLYVLGTAAFWATVSRAGISIGGVSPHVFKDLVIVGAAAVPYVGLMAFAERRYIVDGYRSIRGRYS